MQGSLRLAPVAALTLGAFILAGCGAQPSAVNVPKSPGTAQPANQTTTSPKPSLKTPKNYVVGAQSYSGQANLQKYEKAATAHPTDYQAQLTAGVSAFVNHHYNAAITYYQKAAKLQPHNGEPVNNIGNVYFRGLGKPKSALSYYRQATHVQPGYVYGWWNLALCEKAVGDMTAAKAAVSQGLQSVPKSNPYYNDLKTALGTPGK